MTAAGLVVASIAGPVVAQDESGSSGTSAASELARGKALYEAGSYQEAADILRVIVEAEPMNVEAAYTLARTSIALGRAGECAAQALAALEYESDLAASLYALAGKCLAADGALRKAELTMKRGIKRHPDNGTLRTNLAVVLAEQGDTTKAKQQLKKAISAEPANVLAHTLLGDLLAGEGYRTLPMFCYLRVVALDPKSPRAATAAEKALKQVNLGIEKTGEKKITIQINANGPTSEGDFDAIDLMLSLAAATSDETKSPTEQQVATLVKVLELVEAFDEKATGRLWHEYAPLFIRIQNTGHAEAFAYLTLTLAGSVEAREWLRVHPEETELLVNWLRDHAREPSDG